MWFPNFVALFALEKASLVAPMVKCLSACRRRGLNLWVGKISWRRKWQPTPVFLPESPMDEGAWWITVHVVAKSRTRLSNFILH